MQHVTYHQQEGKKHKKKDEFPSWIREPALANMVRIHNTDAVRLITSDVSFWVIDTVLLRFFVSLLICFQLHETISGYQSQVLLIIFVNEYDSVKIFVVQKDFRRMNWVYCFNIQCIYTKLGFSYILPLSFAEHSVTSVPTHLIFSSVARVLYIAAPVYRLYVFWMVVILRSTFIFFIFFNKSFSLSDHQISYLYARCASK